uniref:Uncharacterized protein n=1 Tax=Glossina morsitans morsitans TaxID=37546 RepID=A0A1B0FA58_GLOMM
MIFLADVSLLLSTATELSTLYVMLNDLPATAVVCALMQVRHLAGCRSKYTMEKEIDKKLESLRKYIPFVDYATHVDREKYKKFLDIKSWIIKKKRFPISDLMKIEQSFIAQYKNLFLEDLENTVEMEEDSEVTRINLKEALTDIETLDSNSSGKEKLFTRRLDISNENIEKYAAKQKVVRIKKKSLPLLSVTETISLDSSTSDDDSAPAISLGKGSEPKPPKGENINAAPDRKLLSPQGSALPNNTRKEQQEDIVVPANIKYGNNKTSENVSDAINRLADKSREGEVQTLWDEYKRNSESTNKVTDQAICDSQSSSGKSSETSSSLTNKISHSPELAKVNNETAQSTQPLTTTPANEEKQLPSLDPVYLDVF